ncbi:urease accessory protein UreF [Neptunicella sp. SCSIO 80796]|uniref:urease accessory protein UreF n=1 Tax=Neptunicella plasticusilytica TaxID=3117012 RepID=UPI003A4DEBAA
MPTKVTRIHPSPLKLARLLQLCSANLPVGGFAFSQGLEYAVEQQWVKDTVSTYSWIELNFIQSVARTDLAILKRCYQCLTDNAFIRFGHYNQMIIACRESAELRMADLAMGKALIRLLKNLDELELSEYDELMCLPEISFVSAFALAAWLWRIDLDSTLSGYSWTFIDNQVAAATKLVPLGQTQAQNLLFDLTQQVAAAIRIAMTIEDDELGGSLPRVAMASAWHETQYSRLFRS